MRKEIKCPKCGSHEIYKKHNAVNLVFNPAFYVLDIPFSPVEYTCDKCEHAWTNDES